MKASLSFIFSLFLAIPTRAFSPTRTRSTTTTVSSLRHQPTFKPASLQPLTLHYSTSSSNASGGGGGSGYIPPEQSNSNARATSSAAPKKQPLLPRIGDLVRFYDLDGGNAQGQVLIGRISFISTKMETTADNKAWTVELTELEDVGEGYYAEYGSRKRQWKRTTRDLVDVSPVAASFVRSESAYKVPLNKDTQLPVVRAETYDLEQYEGPLAQTENGVNQDIVQADAVLYNELKGRLFRYAALAGATGTLIADLTQGMEFAIIYGAGFLASLVYLFLLSLKTDTLSAGSGGGGGFAQKISNLRFGMPIFVLLGVALYNQSLGDANPVGTSGNLLDTVTARQFAAAVVGFLTYRLPLFVVQIQAAFESPDGDTISGVTLPGSAGLALQMVAQDSPVDTPTTATASLESLPTVLLISGPQATGRSELVDQLVATDERFVRPTLVDKVKDAATFERLEQRSELLAILDGRYGLTASNLIASAKDAVAASDKVVVVDANVALAQQIAKVGGLRLVGVWVGLDSVGEFEQKLQAAMQDGSIDIPEDETPESVVRARIKEIVKEIEYGLSSGIFEFTVLNRNAEDSLKQLQQAGAYCFK